VYTKTGKFKLDNTEVQAEGFDHLTSVEPYLKRVCKRCKGAIRTTITIGKDDEKVSAFR
jgi:hypothetical protein